MTNTRSKTVTKKPTPGLTLAAQVTPIKAKKMANLPSPTFDFQKMIGATQKKLQHQS